jgi:hypothetical protein
MATVCVRIATLPQAGAKSRYTLAFQGVDLPEIDVTDKSGQHVYYHVPAGALHAYKIKFYPAEGAQPMEYHPTSNFKAERPQVKAPICQLVQDAIVTSVSD